MRIMFVARAVDRAAGGVERLIVTLMNALVARTHTVDLLTWDASGAESFYPIAHEVAWHRLGTGNGIVSKKLAANRARYVRTLIAQRRPHVIVCFQDGPFRAIRACVPSLAMPVIVCECNAPNRFEHICARRYRGLIYQSFNSAARIIIQQESYKSLYPSFLQGRIAHIPLPVLPTTIRARPNVPGLNGRYRLLSVGRLGFQKHYQVLIDAFARVASRFPDWELAIIGDGGDRARLEASIKIRGLGDRITLPGTTESISDWYKSSHLFCLSSRWEGFPNVLAEAHAHGLPSIAFAECAGARDLIQNGISGLLVEGNGDPASLALGLEKLMSNDKLRWSMGIEGIANVKSFDPPKIFSRWEQVLGEVALR